MTTDCSLNYTSSIHENSKLKPGENIMCTEIVSDIQNNFCTKMFSPCSAKRRASGKDLPVEIWLRESGSVWYWRHSYVFFCAKLPRSRTVVNVYGFKKLFYKLTTTCFINFCLFYCCILNRVLFATSVLQYLLYLGIMPSIRDGVHRSGMLLYLHLKRI